MKWLLLILLGISCTPRAGKQREVISLIRFPRSVKNKLHPMTSFKKKIIKMQDCMKTHALRVFVWEAELLDSPLDWAGMAQMSVRGRQGWLIENWEHFANTITWNVRSVTWQKQGNAWCKQLIVLYRGVLEQHTLSEPDLLPFPAASPLADLGYSDDHLGESVPGGQLTLTQHFLCLMCLYHTAAAQWLQLFFY